MNSHERAQLHDQKNSLSLSDPSNHDTSTIANMLRANQPCLDSIPISHRLENVASSLQDLPICMYKESATNSNESLVFCESTYKARTLQLQQGEQQVFVYDKMMILYS
jgi:hypothetical protein